MKRAFSRTFAAALLTVTATSRADQEPPGGAPTPPVSGPPPAVAEGVAGCEYGWEANVYATARSSVVQIVNTEARGWGAGFFWRTNRRIVTAMHVLEQGRTFEVRFANGARGRARIVAGDRESDVGLLELETEPPADLRPLELADAAALPLGGPVITIGHPFAGEDVASKDGGLHAWTVTHGILGGRTDREIQIDVHGNPGNSGGPVLDCRGRVIAIEQKSAGSIHFGASARAILDLEGAPQLPAVKFDPKPHFRLGFSLRESDRTSWAGPAFELDLTLRKLVVLLQAAVGVSLENEAAPGRTITSRTNLQAYLAAGYAIHVTRWFRLTPLIGAAAVRKYDNAVRIVGDRLEDASSNDLSVRFAPGLLLAPFGLGYRFELASGREAAHVLTWMIPLSR